jgi:hypothetical protein
MGRRRHRPCLRDRVLPVSDVTRTAGQQTQTITTIKQNKTKQNKTKQKEEKIEDYIEHSISM